MWICNHRYGDFKKSGELKYSIRSYRDFTNNKERFYLEVFDKLSSPEIYHYLIGVFLTNAAKKINPVETEYRQNFYVFFGDQFVNQTGGMLLLYKNNKVRFIIKRPMDGPLRNYEIELSDFCMVFNEYIKYCETENLI